jgi:hypothetical protein
VAPGGVLLDRVLDEELERGDVPVERFDDAVDAGLKSLGHHAATILLDGAQRSELSAAHD